MTNVIMVITPYWYQGTWVFDDESLGLDKEPFVVGVPEMIDDMVKDIPNARQGFRLTFSASPFPSFQREFMWVREEYGGHWYRLEGQTTEGWLCPALFKYFESAPRKLYVRADKLSNSPTNPVEAS
ncbi:DUF6717 family protein [Chloroflexota bacterium]